VHDAGEAGRTALRIHPRKIAAAYFSEDFPDCKDFFSKSAKF